MKIKKIETHQNPETITQISIENFNKNNYKKLKQLLKKLNFTEDKETQKRSSQLADYGLKKLYKKQGYSKLQVKIKILKHKVSKQISQLTKNKIIDREYRNKNEYFSFYFMPSKKQFFTIIKSNEFTGEEFLSLIFSNCQ